MKKIKRAALLDELLQRGRAFLAESAAIFRRHGSRAVSLSDLLARLIGNHDRVETLLQIAGLDVGVLQCSRSRNPKSSNSQRVQPSSMLGTKLLYMPMRGAATDFRPSPAAREEIAGRGIAVNRLAGFPELGHFFPRVNIGRRQRSGRFRMIQLEGELRRRLQRRRRIFWSMVATSTPICIGSVCAVTS